MDVLNLYDSSIILMENGKISLKDYERCEQIDVLCFLPSNSTVLELGGRYGAISCLINRLLKDPTKHLVIEPDAEVIPYLEDNKRGTDSKFEIFHGTVSTKKLKFNPLFLSSYTSETYGTDIETKTLQELEEEHQLKFDTLVADCEGFFEHFVTDNDMSKFRIILLEEDQPERCDYEKCLEKLRNEGFVTVCRYFNECYRSVHVNTKFLPYNILKLVSLNPLGFFGKLAYVTEKYYEDEEDCISCVGGMFLVLETKKSLLVSSRIFPVGEVDDNITFRINGRECKEEKLEEGVHVLEIETSINSPIGWSIKPL